MPEMAEKRPETAENGGKTAENCGKTAKCRGIIHKSVLLVDENGWGSVI